MPDDEEVKTETAIAVIESPVDTPVTIAEVANNVNGIPMIQGQLAEWCRQKLGEAREEEQTLRNAYTEAKARKWKCSTLLSSANKALQRVQFYEKVADALDAGYMLFPPIDNISAIAIRTDNVSHDQWHSVRVRYGMPGGGWDTKAPVLPSGEGEYKNPRVRWYRSGTFKDEKGEIQEWAPVRQMENPEFPLVMARVSCIEATSAAMEQKVFDEIAIYPAKARKDPVILGRIQDPIKKRWLNFLISWRVDKRDL